VSVLIFGAGGQLGRALLAHNRSGVRVVAVDRTMCDLEDARSIERCVAEHTPSIVINAAAYTMVDKAESDAAAAYRVNDVAVGVLAAACAAHKARFLHVSTDFVFDGSQGRPYRPHDVARPLNVYGASKLAGETRVQAIDGLDWRIIRTAWVYAATGRNFVLTMLRLFRERDRVQVVADQIGTPTSASSLADCVWRAAQDNGEPAILHFTDAGVASWYDFAVAIYEEARSLGAVTRDVEIVPIATEQYPTPAQRPPFSVLDKTSTWARLGIVPAHWRMSLRKVLEEMS
jgi:dTDP-4-dehydrorhamnose reductase